MGILRIAYFNRRGVNCSVPYVNKVNQFKDTLLTEHSLHTNRLSRFSTTCLRGHGTFAPLNRAFFCFFDM